MVATACVDRGFPPFSVFSLPKAQVWGIAKTSSITVMSEECLCFINGYFFWRLSKVATLPRQVRTYSFPVFWDGWGMLPKLPYVRNVRRSDSLLMQAVPCWISSLPPGVYRTPPRIAMEPYQGDPQLLSVIYLINSAVIYLRLKRQRSYFVTFVSVSPHSKVGFLLPILCEVA